MTLEMLTEQIGMERARMFKKAECIVYVEDMETHKALQIICRGDEKPGIGKVPYALFRINLPNESENNLPDKMKLEILTMNPKMNLRKVTGSATKILRMLHRNFEEMNIAQAAM